MAETSQNNITVNMENLSEEERKQLLALIEKANQPKEGLWKPAIKEPYYFIQYSTSDITKGRNDGMYLDNDRFLIGNCFRTKEDAEFAIEQLKVLAELRKLSGGFKPKPSEEHYNIYYSYQNKEISIAEYYSNIHYGITFKSKKEARQAIATIGEDRLKKYYFGIED